MKNLLPFILIGSFLGHVIEGNNGSSIYPSSSLMTINETSSMYFSAVTTNDAMMTTNYNQYSTAVLVQTNSTSSPIQNSAVQPNPVTTPMNSSVANVIPTTSASTRCFLYTHWNPDVYLESSVCLTAQCVQNYALTYGIHLECNSRKKKDEPQWIAKMFSQYLLLRAEKITQQYGAIVLTPKIIELVTGKNFAGEFGTLKKSFFVSHDLITIDFSHHNGIKDVVQFPSHLIEGLTVSYQCVIYTDIYNPTDSFKYWKENTPLREALGKLPPSLTNPAPRKDIGYQINSNILYFELSPLKEKFEDYTLLKFFYRDPKGTTNHRCVRYVENEPEHWSDSGCYVHQKEEDYILCRCDSIVGRYAIISDLTIKPAPPTKLQRNSITVALIAISVFGIAAAIASMLLPKVLKCQHLGGMLKVYKAADITFIVYFLVVIISVLKSEDLGLSKILAATLHFLHHASAIWFIVEGVHLYHEMTPLYSSSIGMIFFYSTLAFGTSAALAGAATGYDYIFSGKTQFLWPYAPGIDSLYMYIPTIGIIFMQIIFDTLLVWELMTWIGSKYDYLYTRSTSFITRCTGYTLVFVFTHVLGVMAMNNQDSSTYAWLFIGFYGIETICLLYHHCISNIECWTWKEVQEFQREMELLEKLKAEAGDSSESSDSDSDESDHEDEQKEMEKKKNGDLIINMENGNVFYEKSTPSIQSDQQQPNLTRRDSKFSTSSQAKLIRSDSSCSSAEHSHQSLREASNLYPNLENIGYIQEAEEPSDKSSEEPVGGDEPSEEPVGDDEPSEEPVGDDEPSEKPVSGDEPSEEPVGGNEPSEDQVGGDEPSDKPAGEEQESERPPSQASIATTVSYKSLQGNEESEGKPDGEA